MPVTPPANLIPRNRELLGGLLSPLPPPPPLGKKEGDN